MFADIIAPAASGLSRNGNTHSAPSHQAKPEQEHDVEAYAGLQCLPRALHGRRYGTCFDPWDGSLDHWPIRNKIQRREGYHTKLGGHGGRFAQSVALNANSRL